MVRAGCMRDDRQFSTGSRRLERRNTLLPGVDLCGRLQGKSLEWRKTSEIGRWLMEMMGTP
jgi:hypothetical protein